VNDVADAGEIRREILARVADYYEAAYGSPKPFVPGESRVSYAGRVFDAEEITAAVDASLEFWLTYGRHSERFERELGAYLGVRYCLLVNSGSSANLLAFAALTADELGERRIRRGDEVITVAAAFPTTVAPILQYGAVPVFVDVLPETANIDVARMDGALSPRTKAVFLAHTLGNAFDVDAVTAFCERNGLWLIEDNCDALGTRWKGRLTGSFGHIGTSSFYPPHHMTMGEGGAVYTDDPKLNRILIALRDWGRDCTCPPGVDDLCGSRFGRQSGELPFGYDHKYVYSRFGYNLKATDIQAAIGCVQLAKLPGFVEARRRNFDLLTEGLAELEDVLRLPTATPGSEPSWFGYLMTLRDGSGLLREDITRMLEEEHIQTRLLFGGNVLRQPCFDAMRASGEGYRVVGDLPNTDRIMRDSFWIGVYPGLSEEMIAYMARELVRACRG
jgi:CDP-6-deoxy-D-xylo-4-hexulose-3-dehydrase